MKKYTFVCTVEVADDHPNADDPEWWWDAAWGALSEYGATATAEPLQFRQKLITLRAGDQVFLRTTDPDPTVQARGGPGAEWGLPLDNDSKPHVLGTIYTGEW